MIATPCAPARRTSVVQIIHGPSACNYIVTGVAGIIASPIAAVIASHHCRLVARPAPQKLFFLFSLPKRRDTPFLLKETKGPLSSPRESKSESRGTLSKVPVVSCQKVPTFVRHLATPKKKIHNPVGPDC